MSGIRKREDPVFRVFYHIKIEGTNSGPTKSSGFMGIPVLRGSGLEGFYCIYFLHVTSSLMLQNLLRTNTLRNYEL